MNYFPARSLVKTLTLLSFIWRKNYVLGQFYHWVEQIRKQHCPIKKLKIKRDKKTRFAFTQLVSVFIDLLDTKALTHGNAYLLWLGQWCIRLNGKEAGWKGGIERKVTNTQCSFPPSFHPSQVPILSPETQQCCVGRWSLGCRRRWGSAPGSLPPVFGFLSWKSHHHILRTLVYVVLW